MNHYSEEEKLAVKKFVMDEVSKTLDVVLEQAEINYAYDPFRGEVWIDGFNGKFEIHFIPANEMNDGLNRHMSFHHRRGDKY